MCEVSRVCRPASGWPAGHPYSLSSIRCLPARAAWHIGYQDVLAIGALFTSGRLNPERVIALAGPAVKQVRACCAPAWAPAWKR